MSPSENTAINSSEEYLRYRAVSLSAVTSLILGIISLPAILFPKLLILPLVGVLIGLFSVIQVGRRRDEFAFAQHAFSGC